MNRTTGEGKYERAWTNYYVYYTEGKTAYDDSRYRLVVARPGVDPTDAAPGPGWEFQFVVSGYNQDEAKMDMRKKLNVKWHHVSRAAPEPQPSMFG